MGRALARSRAIALVLALAAGLVAAPRLPPVFGLRAQLARYGVVVRADGRLRFTQPIPGTILADLAQEWRAHLARAAARRRAPFSLDAAALRRIGLRLLNPIVVAVMLVAYGLVRFVQRRVPGG